MKQLFSDTEQEACKTDLRKKGNRVRDLFLYPSQGRADPAPTGLFQYLC